MDASAKPKLELLDEQKALATLEGSLTDLEVEKRVWLDTITAASKMGEFETVKLLIPQVAETRKLQLDVRMAIAAYHSGVHSAVVLACFLPQYLALPMDERSEVRGKLLGLYARFDSESEAVSKSAIRQQEAATKQAEAVTKQAEAATKQAEEAIKQAEEVTKQAAAATRREEAACAAEVERARNDRARLRVALRQMAYDSSNPLWRFFGGSIHKITDVDVTNLLSGMSQEDIDAIMAKF
ncbi:MAG: hypothetical protein LBF24_03240 [Puniceicoccales bacterium]|jgi:flagellar biosynthesis GTPase FlhF|nr:hypothetical protein [Puniceicoccales bacterium]